MPDTFRLPFAVLTAAAAALLPAGMIEAGRYALAMLAQGRGERGADCRC